MKHVLLILLMLTTGLTQVKSQQLVPTSGDKFLRFTVDKIRYFKTEDMEYKNNIQMSDNKYQATLEFALRKFVLTTKDKNTGEVMLQYYINLPSNEPGFKLAKNTSTIQEYVYQDNERRYVVTINQTNYLHGNINVMAMVQGINSKTIEFGGWTIVKF